MYHFMKSHMIFPTVRPQATVTMILGTMPLRPSVSSSAKLSRTSERSRSSQSNREQDAPNSHENNLLHETTFKKDWRHGGINE